MTNQPAESLALLVSFLKSGLKERQILKMLSVFSCIGPLGELFQSVSYSCGGLYHTTVVPMRIRYIESTKIVSIPTKVREIYALTFEAFDWGVRSAPLL